MKKTLTFLFMLGTFSIFSTQAQVSNIKIGLKAGANMANVSNTNLSNKTAFHVGAVGDIKLSKSFSVQPEVVFSMQGAQKGKQELNLNYLNIPIMAKLYLYEGLNLQAGPQVGMLLSAKMKYGSDIPVSLDLPEDIYQDTNNLDFAVNFGAGYDFPMGLFIDFRYSMGMTSVAKDDALWGTKDMKNNVMQLSIGYKFKTYKPSKY